jgi:hypothetical protein
MKGIDRSEIETEGITIATCGIDTTVTEANAIERSGTDANAIETTVTEANAIEMIAT